MIHQFIQNGRCIVVDGGSGCIHSVDALAYDAISEYSSFSRDELASRLLERHHGEPGVDGREIDVVLSDIEELIGNKQLFADDIIPDPANSTGKVGGGDIVKALCLHVSHTCNMVCDYCFASQGNFGGKDALMSLEVGKKSIDFVLERSGTRKNLEVDFFGGEPLLNFGVVKEIVAYARSREADTGKHFRFTLTTNGLLLDDDINDFLNKEMHNVVLSLDGRREVHDSRRKLRGGKSSYGAIVPKFQKLVQSRDGKNYYMRGTFTHDNTDFVSDILHMAELGFTELSMEPVVAEQNLPYALTASDLPVLERQYELLAENMLRLEHEGRPINFYHYMIDLEGGPCAYKRHLGCGSGTEYLAVTPDGALYPCHRFVGNEEYRMGDVWGGVTNTAKREAFRSCNAVSRPECRECWARVYCSGGCAASAYDATGDINGVYDYGCRLFKKRLECAIYMKVVQSGN